VAAGRRAWDRVILLFAFPPAIRRVIYTTNAIVRINARLRQVIKSRGHLPSDDAATKLIWLAPRSHSRLRLRGAHLEEGGEPVRDPLRGAIHAASPYFGLNHEILGAPGGVAGGLQGPSFKEFQANTDSTTRP
jgi:hypothetical protein